MRHVASTLLTLLVVLGIAVVGGVLYGKGLFTAPGPTTGEVIFSVEEGARMDRTAERLEEAGIITSAAVFRMGARYLGLQDQLKAAEYRIAAGASMEEVLGQITRARGTDVVQLQITIPEGFTTYQVLELVRDSEYLTGEITVAVPEGAILPETYNVTRGSTRDDFLMRIMEDRDEKLAELWETRDPDLPIETPEQAIILASIVEKETGERGEREIVASVFINRLRRDMSLGSDPTVIYGLTGGVPIEGFDLTTAHLRDRGNPYNTRIHKGLPPGPIANPGEAAIRAVLRPATTDFLYFVADGSGGHAFARTLAEHNENVRRWQEIERQRQNSGN